VSEPALPVRCLAVSKQPRSKNITYKRFYFHGCLLPVQTHQPHDTVHFFALKQPVAVASMYLFYVQRTAGVAVFDDLQSLTVLLGDACK
jgi:hypothetical protein